MNYEQLRNRQFLAFLCYMIETHPNGTWYPKQIADETVINLGL